MKRFFGKYGSFAFDSFNRMTGKRENKKRFSMSLLNNRRVLKSILLCIIFILSFYLSGSAANLYPTYSAIGKGWFDKPFTRPWVDTLKCITLTYDRAIKLTKKPKAYILNGKKKIAKATSFEVKNYGTDSVREGILYIYFSKKCLPKNHNYTFRLDSASICLVDDQSIKNSPYSNTIKIPNDMGKGSFHYENGSRIVRADGFSVDWGFEGLPVGKPEWELYREGELVGKYPVNVSNDWNLGAAFLHFDECTYFDEGVNYRLVLPAGSVYASRKDIVNREETLEFVGAYTKPKQYPHIFRMPNSSLYDEDKQEYTTKFFYRQKVKLVPGKTIVMQIDESDKGKEGRKWEATPTLTQEGSKWVLTVTFHGVIKGKVQPFHLEIPPDIAVEDPEEP